MTEQRHHLPAGMTTGASGASQLQHCDQRVSGGTAGWTTLSGLSVGLGLGTHGRELSAQGVDVPSKVPAWRPHGWRDCAVLSPAGERAGADPNGSRRFAGAGELLCHAADGPTCVARLALLARLTRSLR